MLWLLWELLGQLTLDLLVDLGLQSAGGRLQQRGRARPLLAGAGLLLAGALAGFAFSLVLSSHLMATRLRPIPGASLVLSPLLAGLVMTGYGSWQKRRGIEPTVAATFWGGACFAFGFAAVRLLMLP